MTGGEPSQDDARSTRRNTARSSMPHLVSDGGSSRRDLFEVFPDPLIYYEFEQDTAIVRCVNSAFERRFDIDASAITEDRLVDHLLVDTANGEPDLRWEAADPASDTVETDTIEKTDTTDVDPEATAEGLLERLTEGERVTVGVEPVGGEQQYFRLEAVPSPDDDAGGYIVYTTVTDETEQVNRLRKRANRLERVASVTAHDLRNPLDVAKIRLEAARDTGETVHFEKVEEALDRIQRIIESVLSVGGGEIAPSDAVVLDDIAEAAWSTVETADATLVLEDTLPTIQADADHLQQVFENLFRNAVEHGRTDVTVRVGGVSDGFYVADDGPGIPSTERDHVFEPGYSAADDNTGLGLAIVQQIAEDHGWQVAVTASDSGGARFTFRGVETNGP